MGSSLGAADARRFAVAVGIPLGAAAFAYALWRLSDQALYVGPLDRAAFGWLVVTPVWLVTPLVAAWSWRDLSPRAGTVARLVVLAVVAAVAAALLWTAASSSDCTFGPRSPAIDWLVPAVASGLLVGLGPVVGGSLALREHRARRDLQALLVGISANAVFGVLAVAVFTWAIIFIAGCQRPR